MTGEQLVGLAAVLTAVGVITGQVLAFLSQRRTHQAVEYVSAQVGHVDDAVKTSNGQTVGEIIEANEVRREVANGG